ncbi:hypothetical protein TNCV_3575971 [Trichonephila clavipes]|nr:hypothetical protein TNCV_3575971 [Trichonephila clavipes]
MTDEVLSDAFKQSQYADRIRVKPSIVATSVSYTSDFRQPQKNKSKGLRAGEHGGEVTVGWFQFNSRDI